MPIVGSESLASSWACSAHTILKTEIKAGFKGAEFYRCHFGGLLEGIRLDSHPCSPSGVLHPCLSLSSQLSPCWDPLAAPSVSPAQAPAAEIPPWEKLFLLFGVHP